MTTPMRMMIDLVGSYSLLFFDNNIGLFDVRFKLLPKKKKKLSGSKFFFTLSTTGKGYKQ